MIDFCVLRHRLHLESVSRAVALTVVFTVGCQTSPSPPPQELAPTVACLIVEDSARPQLNVAIHWPINPAHAPSPGHAAERLVFRQLYETLVNVDCDGRILPGLAESWKADVSGRVWDFHLRADATFWDGAQVTPDAVVESWKTNAGLSPTISAFASMTVRGERDLQVELKMPFVEAHLFARPDVAVTRRDATGPWPLGSGPFRVDANSNVNVVRVTARTGAARLRSIDFRTFSIDSRSALDARADAVVSAEPSVLQYARALPDYELVPLAWSRTYVLARPGADTASLPPPDAMSALGRDAVRADSRPAVPPFWWRLSECRTAVARSVATPTGYSNTITYPRRDAIARAIAERLVALAWPVNRAPDWLRNLLAVAYENEGPPVARGLDDRELLTALSRGNALAFVVSSPRSQGRICAPHFAPEDPIARTLTAGNLQVTPLLDVREYLVQRRGLGRVVVDGDGTIRFLGGR